MLTPLQLVLRFFERDQTLLPFLLQSTRDKTMLWLDSTVPALGLLGLVARALDRQLPLLERLIVICFEALDRLQRGLDAGRLDRFQYSLGDRLVDLHSPHIQAQGSPLLGQLLALAVIPGRGGLAGVVGRQAAAALSTVPTP